MEKIIRILISPITVTFFIIGLTIGLVFEAISKGFIKAERIMWK